VSYVEVMGQYLNDNPKILNAVKNILQNVHKNYLVFVEFINKNLTPEQRSKTHEWASSLESILEDRPSVKTYYKNTNSQILAQNNEISINLLKTICWSRFIESDFLPLLQKIIKKIDVLSVIEVRKLLMRVLERVRNIRKVIDNTKSQKSIFCPAIVQVQKPKQKKMVYEEQYHPSIRQTDNPYSKSTLPKSMQNLFFQLEQEGFIKPADKPDYKDKPDIKY